MWATALRELRYHPARYVATLLAIAISVGFMAAASIVTETESYSMAMASAAPFTKADLIVSVNSEDGPSPDVSLDEVTNAIAEVAGVKATEPILQATAGIEQGTSIEFAHVTAIPSAEFDALNDIEGTYPEDSQILLGQGLAKSLDVSVDSVVTVNGIDVTVSGLSDDRSGRSLMGGQVYTDKQWFASTFGDPWVGGTNWVLRLDDGASASDVATATKASLAGIGMNVTVDTLDAFLDKAATEGTMGIDSMKYVLWVFAGIAMIVGLITIANTFTILLTGRRRQIGLIRAIGATGAQVRRSIWAEAVLLGLAGSLIGVGIACGLSALLGLYTGSVYGGLQIPVVSTGVAILLGIIITVIACVTPARRATKVSPIEALQPATEAVERRRVSIIRAVVCGLLVAAGIVGVVLALSGATHPLVTAILAAGCLAIGVLFGARLFVPAILSALGMITKHFGSSGSVAAKNVVRDPRRASATATALMLAVGLIVTLQVGSASVVKTITAKIDSELPFALTMSALSSPENPASIPESTRADLGRIDGVTTVVDLPCKWVKDPSMGDDESLARICSYLPEVSSVATQFPATMPENQVWVSGGTEVFQDGIWHEADGREMTYQGTDSPLNLMMVESPVAAEWHFVSPETYERLDGESVASTVLVASVAKDANVLEVTRDVESIVGQDAWVGGSIGEKYVIDQAMSIIVGVLTALLAVAVIIALVGVSNTLTLSVIERSRESAILRAMGAQKRQLQLMALIEALMLTITGALVGLGAGAFFGWLGARAMVGEMLSQGVVMPVYFGVDWAQTLGLLGILIVATVAASLLPGRRAAKASPVEALAEV